MNENSNDENMLQSLSCEIIFIDNNNNELPSTKVDKVSNEETTIDKIISLAQDYVTILQLLWQYTNEIGSVAQNTSLLNIAQLPFLIKELQEKSKRLTSNTPIANSIFKFSIASGKEIKIDIPLYDFKDVKKIEDSLKYHGKALNLLHETVLQQMVNAWENILAKVLEWKLQADPYGISKNHTITYSQILAFPSMEDVKKHVIYQEIKTFLKENTTLEQIRYFNREFKVDLESQLPLVDDLCEIVLRRHVIVHAGGIANHEYLSRVKKLKKLSDELPNLGDNLSGSVSYIKKAWSILFSSGIILLHRLAVSEARKKKSKDAECKADDILNNAAFTNIKYSQYFSAELILQYAYNRHLANPRLKLMILINLAQTYKWQNRKDKCAQLLTEYDWNSCSAEFKICVDALRDDYNSFLSDLRIAMQEGSITISTLYDWPIFKIFRKKHSFKDDIKKIFECHDFNEDNLSKYQPLLDFESDDKLAKLKDVKLEFNVDSDKT